MAVERILTIGAHGWTADAYFDALAGAGVDLLVDVRQRRGVRGHEYAFANHKRLVAGLEARGIGYRHELALAPTTEIREAQYAVDKEHHVGQRSREELSPKFIAAYQREILDKVDLPHLLADLDTSAHAVALFCVERVPEACHRSLAAAALAAERGITVEHLVPET